MNTDLIKTMNQSLGTDFPATESMDALRRLLSAFINDLINDDFNRLVTLLYRIDVSEQKLSQLLKDNKGENASLMIADLIIERQAQKNESKRRTKQEGDKTNEDEKW